MKWIGVSGTPKKHLSAGVLVLTMSLAGLLLLAAGRAGSSTAPAGIAASRVLDAACPTLGPYLAPDEARQAATNVAYSPPVSPTLTRYAMALAAASAKARPTVPPPSFVPVDSEPAPTLSQAQQVATACGYTGQVRAVVVSVPLSKVDEDPRFFVDVADKKLHGSAAIGVGVAFDRFGDLHLVYVGGTVNDNDGSDPFAPYTEDKPANPLPHPTGFMILVSVGPYCTTHPKVCGYDHPRGALIRIYSGTREVAHGHTNSKGAVSILVPRPGRYTITSSFLDRGRRYHSKGGGFVAMKGLMMPVTLTGCAPGDIC